MKPLIGIPTRTIKENNASPSFGIRATFPRAIERAGGAPVLIPLGLDEGTMRAIFARLDGLMLAGGVDVHPKEFGENVEEFCGDIDEERDAAELHMTRWALDHALPVFGICRGIQLLNVAAGGSLYQDIPSQLEGKLAHEHKEGEPPSRLTHSIAIKSDSKLGHALGEAQVQVNSLHHQSVKLVAPKFRVVAESPDGIVEGIESTGNNFAIGVQFHPEWLIDDDARMMKLFEEFVRASAGKNEHTPIPQ